MITFERKVSILSELWMEYRNEEAFQDLFAYNDIGFPLAWAFNAGIVESSYPDAEMMINDTWKMFLGLLGLDVIDEEQQDWENLEQVFLDADYPDSYPDL